MNNKNVVKVALCEGRHTMPEGVVGSIFPNAVDPTDLKTLDEVAEKFVEDNIGKDLEVYVTGLTVALVAVIKACQDKAVSLTLYHFNRDTNGYYPQLVQSFPHICPFCGAVSTGWFCSSCGAS